jgi:hypothetical protein
LLFGGNTVAEVMGVRDGVVRPEFEGNGAGAALRDPAQSVADALADGDPACETGA